MCSLTIECVLCMPDLARVDVCRDHGGYAQQKHVIRIDRCFVSVYDSVCSKNVQETLSHGH